MPSTVNARRDAATAAGQTTRRDANCGVPCSFLAVALADPLVAG
jgi:hypothetical protein